MGAIPIHMLPTLETDSGSSTTPLPSSLPGRLAAGVFLDPMQTMHTYLFTTDRLRFRQLNPGDAAHLYELNADPQVIRFTGDAAFADLEEARRFLEAYEHYERHGFGRWAVELRLSGEFLGWCGLRYTEELRGVDLGFRFFRRHWGRGFATEAASACLKYGFGELRLECIYGRCMKLNVASIRVLEKIGMELVGEREFDAHPGLLFKAVRESWMAALDG